MKNSDLWLDFFINFSQIKKVAMIVWQMLLLSIFFHTLLFVIQIINPCLFALQQQQLQDPTGFSYLFILRFITILAISNTPQENGSPNNCYLLNTDVLKTKQIKLMKAKIFQSFLYHIYRHCHCSEYMITFFILFSVPALVLLANKLKKQPRRFFGVKAIRLLMREKACCSDQCS